ncbi:MAG TPA: hypothetical protein VM890_03265, partial [Longimicrobium sp.]|nr:hypothetical protein [Longimicrobium sp.]
MLKQTLVWTALPHRAGGPAAPGATLRLSVLLSPRLWNDVETVESMLLDEFPDFLDLPATMKGASFQVEFAGGPTLPATVVSAARLDSGFWKSLFGEKTRVVPFEFEDLTAAKTLCPSTTDLAGLIEEVYVRTFSLGTDLPLNGVLIGDPGLRAVARPVHPRDELVLTVPETPVDLGGRELPPDPLEPVKPAEPVERDGCARDGCMGCLLLPFRLLRALLRWLLGLLGLSPPAKPQPIPAPPPMPPGGGGGGSGGGGGAPVPGVPGSTPGVPGGSGGAPQPGAPGSPGGSSAPGSGPGGGGKSGPPDPRAAAFLELAAVLAPTAEVATPLPDAAGLADEYDFHSMVAALGDYPELMRLAGLVVDLEVTLGGELPPSPGRVRVLPTVPLQLETDPFQPWTHHLLGDGLFVAAPRPTAPETSGGLLRVHDETLFGVHQVDVAGAATKLANAATNLLAEEVLGDRPANAPEESGLPALQTAGISVVRRGAGQALQEQFLQSWALNAALVTAVTGSPPPAPAGGQPEPEPVEEYFAEDLVRGYRPDVWDDRSKSWHSLCQRVGTYTLLEPAPGADKERTLE